MRNGVGSAIKWIALSVWVSTILVGCKSNAPILPRLTPDNNKKTSQLLSKVHENSFRPRTVSFKASATFVSGDKTNSFKLTARIQPDSVIWLSISAYGYEAVRVLARPDSLFFMNRPDKKYFAGDYSYVNQRMNVELDFQVLQSLLLANSIGLEEMEKVRRYNDKNYYVLSSVNKRKLKKAREKDKSIRTDDDLVFSNWIDPELFRIAKVVMLDLRYNQSVSVAYSDFREVKGFRVPYQMETTIASSQYAELKAEYSRFEVNESLSYPFKVSSKYDEIRD